jgi:hypothetical protein
MTLVELEAKRTEILNRLGIVRASKGDQSVEYSEASKALAVIDSEIARLNAAAEGGGRFRTSFVSFVR